MLLFWSGSADILAGTPQFNFWEATALHFSITDPLSTLQTDVFSKTEQFFLENINSCC